jgi:VWFA-related protein
MRLSHSISASLLWSGISALSAQSLSSPVTIHVPVRLVTVPTLVFANNGQPITGLQADDFRVFDNSRAQKVILDENSTTISLVLAVQVNLDVRQYIPFIAKAGAVFESLLVGESGRAAIVTYAGDLMTLQANSAENFQSALSRLAPHGTRARMIDAGLIGIELLKASPPSILRVLVFIGQSMDYGSASPLSDLSEQAEKENITICALTLPEFGKSFVADTFSLQGVSGAERGGFRAGVSLHKLAPVLARAGQIEKRTDPFSLLTLATGGIQLRFRRQNDLEAAIATLGAALRSGYLLSFSPLSTDRGYHRINVETAVPGPKAYFRSGYWRAD